jgi:hypothetical protein
MYSEMFNTRIIESYGFSQQLLPTLSPFDSNRFNILQHHDFNMCGDAHVLGSGCSYSLCSPLDLLVNSNMMYTESV